MNVFEVTLASGPFSSEKWLLTANSLQVAVEKAQKKLNRSPRLYENWDITSASLVRGQLINA